MHADGSVPARPVPRLSLANPRLNPCIRNMDEQLAAPMSQTLNPVSACSREQSSCYSLLIGGKMGTKKALICALFALFLSGTATASNYAGCLLEVLPGTQNQPAFGAAMRLCADRYPDRWFTIQRGSGRGLFSFKSPASCTIDKGKSTSWHLAANQIRIACDCLYSESRGEWDMCQRYTLPQNIWEQHPDAKTVAQQLAIEHHYRRIYSAHPDADFLFSRSDFQAWWLGEPNRSKVMTSGTTQQIIKLMTDFKQEAASR